ncbi:hypothetical protein HK105_200490 [Polyrhizophydium stewartii]|uniref:Cofilin n=1 Tax=Polyrhizophydium stewartii TaxID=2732419 RepID=A0ABR4NJ94_9FUNG
MVPDPRDPGPAPAPSVLRAAAAAAQSSGIGINSGVISAFEDMKLRRTHAFLVFKISEDGSQIVVDTSLTSAEAARLGSEATYDRFEGRYGVYDLEYDQGLDGVRSKLIFVSWNPNEGKIRSRMMYASSKGALRQRLDGIHSEVQCTDASELAFESLFEAAAPKGTTPVIKAAKEE